jgi:hypothetical protein
VELYVSNDEKLDDKPAFSAGLVTAIITLVFLCIYALVVLHGIDTPR